MDETPGAGASPGRSDPTGHAAGTDRTGRTDRAGRGRDRPSPRTLLIFALLLLVAFGAGFLWQYLEARSARAELAEVQRELATEQMGSRLATALIQADNGAYEAARELMSSFFTQLDEHVEGAEPRARQDLQEILQQRDAVITALSRSAPQSREMLARMFTRYQVVRGGPEATVPIAPPGEADTPGATDTTGTAGEP